MRNYFVTQIYGENIILAKKSTNIVGNGFPVPNREAIFSAIIQKNTPIFIG